MRQRRTNHFGFRLNEDERKALARLADLESLSKAAIVRRLLMHAARRLDAPSARQSQRFTPSALPPEELLELLAMFRSAKAANPALAERARRLLAESDARGGERVGD